MSRSRLLGRWKLRGGPLLLAVSVLVSGCGSNGAVMTTSTTTLPTSTSETTTPTAMTIAETTTTGVAESTLFEPTRDEVVEQFTEAASNGFAEFPSYWGWPVPTLTSDQAGCIGEYMADEYEKDVDGYFDADDMSVAAHLAMASCLDMTDEMAEGLAAAWSIMSSEARCVIEAMLEGFSIESVASGDTNSEEVRAVVSDSGCLSEDQLAEVFGESAKGTAVDGDGTSGVSIGETWPVIVIGSVLAPMPEKGADPTLGLPMPELSGQSFDGTPVEIKKDGRPKIILFLTHW